ncbi:MAG: nucleotidyltransferase family protein [Alphaproteobacteria bacterium]
MEREKTIKTLRLHAADLKNRGVNDLSVFGSTARGDATSDSGIDLLIDIAPDEAFSLVDLAKLKQHLDTLLDCDVDLTIRSDIKPFLQDSILEDEIRVF